MPMMAPEPNAMMTTMSDTFSQEEAYNLLHTLVTYRDNQHRLSALKTAEIAYIGGLLCINDEVEIVIRWPDHLDQVNKAEYLARYCKVPSVLEGTS